MWWLSAGFRLGLSKTHNLQSLYVEGSICLMQNRMAIFDPLDVEFGLDLHRLR